MAAFLEWYIIERGFSGGPPPATRVVAGEGDFEDEDRAKAVFLATSHRGLFELVKADKGMVEVDDLLGGGRFSVRRAAQHHRLRARRAVRGAPDVGGGGGRLRQDLPVSSWRGARGDHQDRRRRRRRERGGTRRSCSACRARTSAGTATTTCPRRGCTAAARARPDRSRSHRSWGARRLTCREEQRCYTSRRAHAAVNLAIETTGLVKTFGALRALDGVDLSIRGGSVYGILGPNGAGKTTTIRVLTTLLKPTGGRALVLGHDVAREAAAVRRRICLTGQSASIDEDLTGYENLILVSRLVGLSWRDARRRAGELLDAFGLADAAGKQARAYSGGMRRRLDIAASSGHDARDSVFGRADHGPGSAQPQPGLGPGPPDCRGRHHGAADDAVPGRGRPPRRAAGGDRSRARHRRGHQPRPEVVGGEQHAALPSARSRPRGCGPRPSSPPRPATRAHWPRIRRRSR